MSAYRPYPKTKPSGVEWLGDVPEGWMVTKLKFSSIIEMGQSPNSEDYNFESLGHPFLQGNAEFGIVSPRAKHYCATAKKLAVPRDFLFSVRAPIGAVNEADQVYGIGRGLCAIRPDAQLADRRFIYYSFSPIREQMASVSTGSTFEGISAEQLGASRHCLPPFPEQIQIATFLDRECGKLDALQAKQERLIGLLKEKRQALISHAVTRGLDPAAKLKPSGIEWLGEVPKHWEVTRLKFQVSRFEQGWSPQCEGRNKEDGEIGVLKVGCVNGGTFRVEEHKALPPELEPRLQYTLKRGDLLISRANTRELVGSAAVVDRDHDDILLCDKLYRLRFHRGVSEIYLSHFLGTSEVRQQIELDASGASASMVNIGQDCIKELNLALPPLAEQRAIVAHLDEKCRKIDQLKAKAERGIELLKERRSALISAAVTGKIDVRDHLPQSRP